MHKRLIHLTLKAQTWNTQTSTKKKNFEHINVKMKKTNVEHTNVKKKKTSIRDIKRIFTFRR